MFKSIKLRSELLTDSESDFYEILTSLLPIFFPSYPHNDKLTTTNLYVTGTNYGYWFIEGREMKRAKLCCAIHAYMGNEGEVNSPRTIIIPMNRELIDAKLQHDKWDADSYERLLETIKIKVAVTELIPDEDWHAEKLGLSRPHYWDSDILWVDGYGFIMAENHILYVFKDYTDLHK
jgi:alpha-D-ribose 1-methylphosphonate 5-triphosphate synthase subunit PhnG